MSGYQYRKSYFGDKTVASSFCLHNGYSYTDLYIAQVTSNHNDATVLSSGVYGMAVPILY